MALKALIYGLSYRLSYFGKRPSNVLFSTRMRSTKPAIEGADVSSQHQDPKDKIESPEETVKDFQFETIEDGSLESLLGSNNGGHKTWSEALTVLKELRKLTLRGDVKATQFIDDPNFQSICSAFEQGCNYMRPDLVVSGLRCLLEFGLPADSKLMQHIENDFIWASRKMSLNTILISLQLQNDYQHTPQQVKIIKDLISLVRKRWIEMSTPEEAIKLIQNGNHFDEEFISRIEDNILEFTDKFTPEETVGMFTALFQLKRRSKPLLRALSYYLIQKDQRLTLRQCCDLCFAIAALHFHDKNLLNKISCDVLSQIETNSNPRLVSSLMTSFSHLKWDHFVLLDTCCQWMEKNIEKCRAKDYLACVLTLANLNYQPINCSTLFPLLLRNLKSPAESKLTSNAWLDLVWSLAVLGRVTQPYITSVLNPDFYKPLLGVATENSRKLKRKLQNVAGVAVVEFPMLDIPPLPGIIDTNKGTSEELPNINNKSVTEALAHFLPGSKYLESNLNTGFGFNIDAEFIVDRDGTPKSILEFGVKASVHKEIKPLPKGWERVALLVWNFKNMTLNTCGISGQNALAVRLLTKLGYLIVEVPLTEYQSLRTTVKQVQYLQRKIKERLEQLKKYV